MKNNELILNVTIDDLKETVKSLEEGNEKFLYISNNLFLIENICTCLHVKKSVAWFNREATSFKFSYDDDNLKNMITIRYNFEPNSCYSFLKASDYISEEQLNTINDKVMRTLKQAKIINIYDSVEKSNEMLYNEVLVFITSGINKGDLDMIKNDFESKYESWKKRKSEINEEGVKLIKTLYSQLIKIKLSEKL